MFPVDAAHKSRVLLAALPGLPSENDEQIEIAIESEGKLFDIQLMVGFWNRGGGGERRCFADAVAGVRFIGAAAHSHEKLVDRVGQRLELFFLQPRRDRLMAVARYEPEGSIAGFAKGLGY